MRGVVKDTDIRADGDSNIVSALVFKMLESVDGSRRNAELNDDTGTSINSAVVALTIDKSMKTQGTPLEVEYLPISSWFDG